MTIENRRDPRFAIEVVAELAVGSMIVTAATQDLSEGGCRLLADRPLAEGAEIRVTLFLTQDGIEDPEEEPFEGGATVVWSSETDGGTFLAGARFGAVSALGRAQLKRFLAAVAEDRPSR